MGLIKKLRVVLALLVMAAILPGCGQVKETAQETEPQHLKIGVLPIEDIMPMVVAEKNGYFAQENLDVELVPFQSAVEQGNAMQSGELDGMVTDMIVAGLIKDSGLDIKITSVTLGVTPEEGRFAIVAAPNSDIKTLQDLKGKKVGISQNSIIEYVTDGLLEAGKIDPSEVKKVSVPKIPVRMEMLFSNQIDAIVVPDPLVTFAEFKGAKILAQDTEKNLSQAVVLFEQKALDQKKEALESFYRAYAKAVDDLNNHPADYQQLMVETANVPEPIAKDYQIQHYPKPQVPAKEDVDNVLKWMDQKGLLKNDLTYENLVQEM
ncbi:ABC transporter substrate-binding protein [Candidatus Formimonas warabiya]|uniref:ABC transporter substrate-binding protein n=1 Tax=Formimonas warabiya TaxID=1761012 RepID=A0A3G1KVU3_FORW1|nr:MetQ/NlpA family ABC transporter substrate-binding protein [Candidatus Formimonas warabiya]ATW26551.1 ABC transporter substrate-binding protein [Candidatus Formimonas warabiya]